jgi:hypothetical protein
MNSMIDKFKATLPPEPEPPFKPCGKQIILDGEHFADMISEAAAAHTCAALNSARTPTRLTIGDFL